MCFLKFSNTRKRRVVNPFGAFVIRLTLPVDIHLDSRFWELWKEVFVSMIRPVVAVTLSLLRIVSAAGVLAVGLDFSIIHQMKMAIVH